MKFATKLFIGVFLFFLLIGRNLPFEYIFFSGLGPWDLFAICLFPFLNYSVIPKKIIVCIGVFFIAAAIGILLNINIGSRYNDIFEILRLFYCIELIALGYLFAKYLNNNIIKDILFFSATVVFIFAYFNPLNPDVLGFVQIWNPNVVGNYLIHCIILILVLDRELNKKTLLYCFLLLIFSFFTYSKATWLMIILISISVFIVVNRFQKLIFLIVLISFIYLNPELISAINILFDAKIDASGIGSSAAAGSTIGARIGLAYSGFLMFLENPIFGVGIGNFENVNDRLMSTLGNMYYRDDNANSLFFHYLGTTGIIGIASIVLLIIEYFKLLTSNVNSRTIYFLVLIFIGISINFQRELFTTNTMYLFIGLFIYNIKKNNENSYIESSY